MKVTLITQDDPFYLAENLDYLIRNFPGHSRVVSCVVLGVSPFGKRESFLQKALKTRRIFGTAFFLRYSLKFLLRRLRGRPGVKDVLKAHGIPVIELQKGINAPESLALIKGGAPDLLVSIAGNQIFRQPLIRLAPKGCLNLHTALLPKYRGLMPSFWVLRNQERLTGVSVFFVDDGIDSGPILVQREIEIAGRSLEALIEHSKRVGMDAILEAIDKIERGDTATMPNDASLMTYFSFPTRSDVKAFRAAGARFF